MKTQTLLIAAAAFYAGYFLFKPKQEVTLTPAQSNGGTESLPGNNVAPKGPTAYAPKAPANIFNTTPGISGL